MSEALEFSVQSDFLAAQKALENTSLNSDQIAQKVLSGAARLTIADIKKEIRSRTTRRTGTLLKAYRHKVNKDDNSVLIYPRGTYSIEKRKSKVYPVAYAQNYGADISPRSPGKTFLQINGGYYARPKNVRITGTHFFESGIQKLQNGGYKNAMEALMIKEWNKYWG